MRNVLDGCLGGVKVDSLTSGVVIDKIYHRPSVSLFGTIKGLQVTHRP